MFQLDGKTAVVIGGAGGLGEFCSIAMASAASEVQMQYEKPKAGDTPTSSGFVVDGKNGPRSDYRLSQNNTLLLMNYIEISS